MRISDWSSDVCSSDLTTGALSRASPADTLKSSAASMICPRPSGVVATDPSPMAPPARPAPISSLIADDGRDRDLVYRLRTIGLHYHALVNARFLCHHEASWQAADRKSVV